MRWGFAPGATIRRIPFAMFLSRVVISVRHEVAGSWGARDGTDEVGLRCTAFGYSRQAFNTICAINLGNRHRGFSRRRTTPVASTSTAPAERNIYKLSTASAAIIRRLELCGQPARF